MGLLQGHRSDLAALSKRGLLLLLVVFVLTRGAGGWLATQPDTYRWRATTPAGDVDLYRNWATKILEGASPYAEVAIEYPPLALPFVLGPGLVGTSDEVYRNAFVALCVAVDAIGLLLLVSLARRWGSGFGPWLWVIGLFLLGPIVWMRLDVVVAVVTLGAVYALARGTPGVSASVFGFGAALKLYPAALGVVLAAARPRDKKLLPIVIGAAALPFSFFVTSLDSLGTSVFGFHGDRGLHIESLWGSFMFLRYTTESIASGANTLQFTGPVADVFEVVAFACVLSAIGAASWIARRVQPAPPRLATLMFGAVTTVVAVAPVLSPQFLIWVLAAGAAAACVADSPLERNCLLLFPAALLTHGLFPFFYDALIEGEVFPRYLLLTRNLLLCGIGVSALWIAARDQSVPVDRE